MPSGHPWGDGYCGVDPAHLDDRALRQSRAVQEKWAGLLSQEVPDARARVKRAIENWNVKVREQLRNETGFRMGNKQNPVSVPIKKGEMAEGVTACMGFGKVRARSSKWVHSGLVFGRFSYEKCASAQK